uniref:Uncharacterized protein n=1 Tax=Moumouvirus sp. 'Monve' TaxID=1128131 RepID=H2ECU1_9VIRU|nr:hypothetical protein mv_L9 [Moumouvirus Monve]
MISVLSIILSYDRIIVITLLIYYKCIINYLLHDRITSLISLLYHQFSYMNK